jgi:outer membrane murein-binding lipoprotein Lpp
MPIYGWDLSHFDRQLTLVDCHLAMQQGITFATHKLGEGMTNVDTTATGNLNNWRNVGLSLIGGYYFGHNSDDPKKAAQRTVDLGNQLVPWWKTFPGWFWQADCETETGQGKPSIAWIKSYADELTSLTQKLVVVYASHGEYGSIPNLGHCLWNANYGSEKVGEFKAIYPGDNSPGWVGYPDEPLILQYSSKATIAGHTKCDADAYRGTLAQLTAIIEGGHTVAHDPLDEVDAALVASTLLRTTLGSSGPTVGAGIQGSAHQVDVVTLSAKVDALNATVEANQAAVMAAIAGLSGPVTGDLDVTGTLHVGATP